MRVLYYDTTCAVIFTTDSSSLSVMGKKTSTSLHPVSGGKYVERREEKELFKFRSGVLRMCSCMCVSLQRKHGPASTCHKTILKHFFMGCKHDFKVQYGLVSCGLLNALGRFAYTQGIWEESSMVPSGFTDSSKANSVFHHLRMQPRGSMGRLFTPPLRLG